MEVTGKYKHKYTHPPRCRFANGLTKTLGDELPISNRQLSQRGGLPSNITSVPSLSVFNQRWLPQYFPVSSLISSPILT